MLRCWVCTAPALKGSPCHMQSHISAGLWLQWHPGYTCTLQAARPCLVSCTWLQSNFVGLGAPHKTWAADHQPYLLLVDSWKRNPKRIHTFSLRLIASTCQGSVVPPSPLPSVQGPSSAAWRKVGERNDLIVWRRKMRVGWEGTSQAQEGRFVF